LNTLFLSAIEVPSLYTEAVQGALKSFAVSLENAAPGQCVGVEFELIYSEHGNPSLSTPADFIEKTADGYRIRSWKTLEKNDPLRAQMGPALIDLSLELSRRIHETDVEKILDLLTAETSESEQFSLGVFPEGFYLIAVDPNVKLEAMSWDHPEPTQDMIDGLMALLWPSTQSSHVRLQHAAPMQRVHEVLTDLYTLSWNDTDPLPLSFRSAPTTTQQI